MHARRRRMSDLYEPLTLKREKVALPTYLLQGLYERDLEGGQEWEMSNVQEGICVGEDSFGCGAEEWDGRMGTCDAEQVSSSL